MNNFNLPKLMQRINSLNINNTNNLELPEQKAHVYDNISDFIVPLEYGLKIKQYRIDNNLTEMDIANKIKIQVNIIKEYEEGTGIYNKTIIEKINNCLNITF